MKRFGSGWSWLVWDGTASRSCRLPNQDSPLSEGKTPILGIDVWEHAYYLNYQNRRPDYLAAWWNVVAWDAVAGKLDAARADQVAARRWRGGGRRCVPPLRPRAPRGAANPGGARARIPSVGAALTLRLPLARPRSPWSAPRRERGLAHGRGAPPARRHGRSLRVRGDPPALRALRARDRAPAARRPRASRGRDAGHLRERVALGAPVRPRPRRGGVVALHRRPERDRRRPATHPASRRSTTRPRSSRRARAPTTRSRRTGSRGASTGRSRRSPSRSARSSSSRTGAGSRRARSPTT